MAKKKHELYKVLQSLSRKQDVRVTIDSEVLIRTGSKASNDLGNKSHGKIDYLVNHLGFKRFYVTEF